METKFVEKFAADWIAAWNAHDLSRIMLHYDEQIIFTSPFIAKLTNREDGTITDKEALQEYFQTALKKFPDLHFELLSVLAGVNSVVLYYKSVEEMQSAEFMEFNAQGKVCRVVAHYSKI